MSRSRIVAERISWARSAKVSEPDRKLFDAAKLKGWRGLLEDKKAFRVFSKAEAQKVLEQTPERVIDSTFARRKRS